MKYDEIGRILRNGLTLLLSFHTSRSAKYSMHDSFLPFWYIHEEAGRGATEENRKNCRCSQYSHPFYCVEVSLWPHSNIMKHWNTLRESWCWIFSPMPDSQAWSAALHDVLIHPCFWVSRCSRPPGQSSRWCQNAWQTASTLGTGHP